MSGQTPLSRLRIENLAHVVTVDEEFTILDDVTIEVTDGVITAIGPQDPARTSARSGSVPGPKQQPVHENATRAESTSDVTVIDGRGRLALPGLVNLHTHLPMTLLRGLAENVDLQGFLRIVWAAEAAVMDPDTVRVGAELGALESLLAGVTTTLDMYFHHEEAHEGARLAGARHVGGPVFFDGPGPDGLQWQQRLDLLAAWPARLRELDGPGAPEVPAAAMPHSTYTNTPARLRELADVIAAWPVGGPGGIRRLVHVHASENLAENADVLARHGATPAAVLADAKLLHGIPDCPTVLGHGVHLTDGDLALIGQLSAGSGPDHRLHPAPGAASSASRGSCSASVAHCPGSNLKLASGALRWEHYRDHGIRLGLGTDGCSSSNDLDLWQTMRQAALLARLTSGDPTAAPAADIIRAATIEGAGALGLDDLIGSLEVGKRADITLIDLDAPHLTPAHDLAALLVFAAGRGDVTDVVVDGRVVVRDRVSTLIETEDLLARARERGRVAATAARNA